MSTTENLATDNVQRARQREFLLWLANVHLTGGDEQTIRKTLRDFPEFFPGRDSILARCGYPVDTPPERLESGYISQAQGLLVILQVYLRNVWRSHALRDKQRAAFRLSEEYWCMYCVDKPKLPPQAPPRYPFEQAVEFLIDNLRVANICKCPTCPTPFFFAKRSSQKICCREGCDVHFRKIRQKNYWNKKGKKKRRERTQEKRTQRSEEK